MPTEADKSFMGDHILVQPVTTNEFRMFSSAIFSMLQTASLLNSSVSHPTTITPPPINSFMTPGMPAPTAINGPWFYNHPTGNSQRSAQAEPIVLSADRADPTPVMDSTVTKATNLPTMDVNIPDLPRSKGTWELAVAQWFEIDPKTGLALKDWPEKWYTGLMRSKTGSKRSHHALVAEEYTWYVKPLERGSSWFMTPDDQLTIDSDYTTNLQVGQHQGGVSSLVPRCWHYQPDCAAEHHPRQARTSQNQQERHASTMRQPQRDAKRARAIQLSRTDHWTAAIATYRGTAHGSLGFFCTVLICSNF